MLFLKRGGSLSVARLVLAGQVLLFLALCAPVPTSSQEPEADTTDAPRLLTYTRLLDTRAARVRDTSQSAGWGRIAWDLVYPDPASSAQQGHEPNEEGRPLLARYGPPSIREAAGPHPNTMIGLATGVTVASVAVPLALGASTCFGSGDYLQLCRLVFVGATAFGGGLGALVGRKVRTDGPPGRATTIIVGAALGAVSAFVVSLPLCGQEEADNPGLLCGYDGMIEPGTVLGAAVVGGIIGYLLGGGSESLGVSQFGPVPNPSGRSAWAVAFTLSR